MRTAGPTWAPYLHIEIPVPPRPRHGIDTASLTELLRKEELLVPCAGNIHLGVPKFPYILGNQGEVHIMTVADHPQIPNQPAPFFCDLPPHDQMVIAALVQKHILNRQFTSAIASTNEAQHGATPSTLRTAYQHHVHLVGYPNGLRFGAQRSPLRLSESVSRSVMRDLHQSVLSAFADNLYFGINPYSSLTADITDNVLDPVKLARHIAQFEIALATAWKSTRKKTIFMMSTDDEPVDMHQLPAFSVALSRGVHDDPQKVYLHGALRFFSKHGGLESLGIEVNRRESPENPDPSSDYLKRQMEYARELTQYAAGGPGQYPWTEINLPSQQIRIRNDLHTSGLQ